MRPDTTAPAIFLASGSLRDQTEGGEDPRARYKPGTVRRVSQGNEGSLEKKSGRGGCDSRVKEDMHETHMTPCQKKEKQDWEKRACKRENRQKNPTSNLDGKR